MGNELSAKFKNRKVIANKFRNKKNKDTARITNSRPVSSKSSISPGKWSWNNGGWTTFEQITSKEIDDSIRIQWDTTSDNPLKFFLTSGTWFNQPGNYNVYEVEVILNAARTKIISVYQINKITNFRRKLKRKPLYIHHSNNISNKNEIYNNLLTMGFDKKLAHQASIDCTTLQSAINICSSLMHNTFDKPVDIARFEFVDKRTQCLIFGYIRNLQKKYLKQANIAVEIIQICAVFYVDEYPLQIKANSQIDGKDRWGKWYVAEIKYHKKANECLPDEPKLNKKQISKKIRFEKLEGIFIHFLAWEEKWDEWIFIEPNTICTCNGACIAGKQDHRLAAPNTQSLLGRNKKNKKHNRAMNKYDTINGEPIAPGCVGLINMGNSTFLNAVIQCIAHTPQLFPYFITRKYELDLNTSNNILGMKGKFAREVGKLLIDMWSNNFQVIRPDSLRQAVLHYAPQFGGLKLIDAMKFLNFLLNSLNNELNLIKVKPYTKKIDCDDKSDKVIAELYWKQHLQKNNSKIVDLFHGLSKSHTTCIQCNTEIINFEPYTHLSVPVKDKPDKSFIIDVFHRKPAAPNPQLPSKPIRHIYYVQKNQKVGDLAKIIANDYNVKHQFVLLYGNWNMMVRTEFFHDELLGNVANTVALTCCILKDYNEEITDEEIKRKKLSLLLGSVCHSIPLNVGFNKKMLFGMPFVVSFLNIHSRREINKVIYERLHLWIGSNILAKPPTLIKLLKLNVDSVSETSDEKKSEPKYEYVRPTTEQWNEYEIEWDIILNNLPFTLRVLTHSEWKSTRSSTIPNAIPCDDRIFEREYLNVMKEYFPVNFQILIEWKQEFFDKIKSIVNKVVCHKEYSKWKKEKKANPNGDGITNQTLYECMDDYIASKRLVKDDKLLHDMCCSNCKKNEKLTKKIDVLINYLDQYTNVRHFYSFPEILIIHLNRYPKLWPNYTVNRKKFESCGKR